MGIAIEDLKLLNGLYNYHYTDINTLALILKNKTIRFSSLSNVDDMNEAKTNDFGSLSSFVFVSCWTYYYQENISLWNMYSRNMSGVRIGFPIDLLFSDIQKNGLRIEKENSVVFHNNFSPNFQVNIIYENNNKSVFDLIAKNEDKYYGRLGMLGSKKDNVWESQKENRYRLFGYDKDSFGKTDYSSLLKAIDEKNPPKIKYVDVPLNKEIFKYIKVLIGPKAPVGTKEIVESLIFNYIGNVYSPIMRSQLKIR